MKVIKTGERERREEREKGRGEGRGGKERDIGVIWRIVKVIKL